MQFRGRPPGPTRPLPHAVVTYVWYDWIESMSSTSLRLSRPSPGTAETRRCARVIPDCRPTCAGWRRPRERPEPGRQTASQRTRYFNQRIRS